MRATPLLAAALLAACAGGPGCAAPGVATVRHGPALAPPPAPPPPAGPLLRVLHTGDTGDVTPQQAAVAAAMAAAHAREPFDVAIFAGDNLYECGPDAERSGVETCAFGPDDNAVARPPSGPPDPAFARLHEGPFAGLLQPRAPRMVLALGNHDVAATAGCRAGDLAPAMAARRKACVEVAHVSALWAMPGRHWVLDQGWARFIVLDGNAVYGDYSGFRLADEEAFLARSVEGCETRSCFVICHQPPVTAGEHVDDAEGRHADRADRIARIVAAGGGKVRAWLAGHDHDLQHLRTASGIDVLVSGNGSRGRPEERFERTSLGGTLLFGSGRWGFGVLTVGSDGWRYRFEDERGQPLHCCAASGAGPCEPVACAP